MSTPATDEQVAELKRQSLHKLSLGGVDPEANTRLALTARIRADGEKIAAQDEEINDIYAALDLPGNFSPIDEIKRLRAELARKDEALRICDAETVQTLLDLLNPLHGSLDKQLYDERSREEWEIPRDREWNVDIEEGQDRDLTQAVLILEDRKRQFAHAALGADHEQ